MAKFSKIVLGTRAERSTELPPLDGGTEPIPVVMRALDGLEEEAVLLRARERAVDKGIKEPKLGEPVYELSLMVETIAVSFLDPESPKTDRQPFFDEGSEQVRKYGREAIQYIYQLQQNYQDEIAPSLLKLDAKETVEAMLKIGGPDEVESRRFLERCRPGLLVNLARSMGVIVYDSLTRSSASGTS